MTNNFVPSPVCCAIAPTPRNDDVFYVVVFVFLRAGTLACFFVSLFSASFSFVLFAPLVTYLHLF